MQVAGFLHKCKLLKTAQKHHSTSGQNDSKLQMLTALGLIHTGRVHANSNANPLMLLTCSVNIPIYTHRFHLLVLRVRVQCGFGLRIDKFRDNLVFEESVDSA